MMDHLTLLKRCDHCAGTGHTPQGFKDCERCNGTGRMVDRKEVTVHICGVKCDHVWDGPEISFDGGESLTCSKCGLPAIDVACMDGA